MKVNSILCLSFIHGALSHVMQERDTCCNNCARDVIGLLGANVICPDDPICQHRADCSGFQQITIEPATVVTVSYTTTTIPSGIVPDYATGCADCKAYAKACSCWRITSTVTTVPTPTTTVILTVTEYSPCGTTISPDPFGCSDPGVCGSLNYIEDDRCGDEGQCACSYDLSGSAVCVEDVDCDAADTCDDDVDCEGDLICWRYSCCDTRVCTNLSKVCADTDSARLGFHGGQKALLPTGRIGEI